MVIGDQTAAVRLHVNSQIHLLRIFLLHPITHHFPPITLK
jgi:hypothetical protein